MLLESGKQGKRYENCSISFSYKDEILNFSSDNTKSLFKDVIDWLYKSGYSFTGDLHKIENTSRRIFSQIEMEEIVKKTSYEKRMFHNIVNSNKYILYNSGVNQLFGDLIKMLISFGIDSKSIKTEGLFGGTLKVPDQNLTKIKKFGEDIDNKDDTQKMTFIEAAQFILKQNDNTPMSAREIWDEIEEQDLVETKGTTPWATLNANILAYSDNSNVSKKYKNKLFHVVSDNPAMFILINAEQEVQPTEGTEKLDDGNDIIKFGSYISSTGGSPNYTSTPSRPVTTGDKYDFTLSSDIENNSSEVKESPTGHIINPFRQAICVLGKSGKGKSTTIDKILKKIGMSYDFIIPTSSTTNLLSQYSPSGNKYIQSRLGKLIMNAQKDPNKLFTAVFDECHKANVIEMINDELLQAISLYRNDKNRFISVDQETADLFTGLSEDGRGNLLIPDNVGFIFLSSKPNIIIDNADFFNRVDIYVLENQPDKDAVDLCTVIGPSITLSSKYFKSIGDKKTGSKTESDIDLIKELHK